MISHNLELTLALAKAHHAELLEEARLYRLVHEQGQRRTLRAKFGAMFLAVGQQLLGPVAEEVEESALRIRIAQ